MFRNFALSSQELEPYRHIHDQNRKEGSVKIPSGSGFRYVTPFPYRVHQMLQGVQNDREESSTVSWLPDGKGFKVKDIEGFNDLVIPKYFTHKSFKSFQRQLNLYGFHRVQEGVDRGAYYHEKFVRDNRKLCLTMSRTRAPIRRLAKQQQLDSALQQQQERNKEREVNIADLFNPLASPRYPETYLQHSSRTRFGGHIASPPPPQRIQAQPDFPISGQYHYPKAVSSASQPLSSSPKAETYEWLFSKGVSFDWFEPRAMEGMRQHLQPSIMDCADEIIAFFTVTAP